MLYAFYLGKKDNLYESSKEYAMVFGFLYKRYEREWFWWQLMVIAQKFGIVLIRVFLAQSIYQGSFHDES